MSLSDAASSISARCRPEYSSTIASWTMVSSRCVAGLSIGIRPFSAMATMISAKSDPGVEQRARHVRKLGRAHDQCQREHRHDHGRLGERCDHHFAAGTDAAKARADVHAGEREEETPATE